MIDTCQQCGAKCCKYFCFEIDEPDTFEEFDDVRWYLHHEGVSVHIDEGDWYISIANPCKMLTGDDRCTNYDARPLICRNYTPETCDDTPGGYDYDAEFSTPEQIEAYAAKTLGHKAYEKAKVQGRAKADGKRKLKKPVHAGKRK